MKHSLLLASCVAALLAVDATAQNYAVSPVGAAMTEGSSGNAFPFTSTTQRRYQQIHSDLPNQSLRITAIGFRQGQSTSTFTGSRTLDIELFMGRSVAWNQASFYFDNNFVQASKTQVMTRKTISFGAGATASPGPSPWDSKLELKLDTPYVWLPVTGSLAWELLVHSNTSNGSMGSLDADSCSGTTGSDTPYGTGCTATGQSTAMSHTVEIAERAGTLMLMFSARYCPANAPAILVLGSQQLAVNVPGLCTSLYTDLTFVLPIGVANAAGDLNRDTTRYYFNAADGTLLAPNPGALTLYSQIFALDAGQPGIKLAGSNGIVSNTPAPNTSKKVEVTRLFNNSGGVTEKMSAIFTTSSVGYGLVTRFTY